MTTDIHQSVRDRLRFFQEPEPSRIVNWLKQVRPSNQWSASGKRITGRCPVHNDSSPSFVINVDRGYCMCSSCGYYSTDIVRFASTLLQCDYASAFKQVIIVEFGLKVDKRRERDLSIWDAQQEVLGTLTTCASQILAHAAQNPSDPEYYYAQPAVTY